MSASVRGTDSRQLVLNLNMTDFGAEGAWLHTSYGPTDIYGARYATDVARTVERGLFDAIFLADGPALRTDPARQPLRALEPVALHAAIAADTTHIGLIATMSTSFNDPHDIAEKILTLNHLSGGRAGWNIVTSYSPDIGPNFGIAALPPRENRYQKAAEFVDRVLELWSGPAHTTCRATSGPSGTPLIAQAGGSPQGQALAARVADIVFSSALTMRTGIGDRTHIRRLAQKHGRNPDDVTFLPGLATFIGSTEEEARRRWDRLGASHTDNTLITRLTGLIGADLIDVDPALPIPKHVLEREIDTTTFTGSLGFRNSVIGYLRENPLPLRDAARSIVGQHLTIVGTPEHVANTLETWFRTGAADGFNLVPDVVPDGLDTFVDQVVPLLQKRDLFRHDYSTGPLRERLGR